jgi:UDP-glucuronate decarboxylase
VKVLLTGGAGFIGERLASALTTAGAEIDIIDDLSRGRDDASLEFLRATGKVRVHSADLLSPKVFDVFNDDYDVIVHLAAIVGVANVLARPYQTLRDNVLLHEAAIRFALWQKRLKRFLFASTSEVYAGSLLHLSLPLPTPEDVPIALPPLGEPRTSYMLSKIYGEAMLIHSGLPYTIVRPHNVYGPRMGLSHVIPQLLEKAHKAQPNTSIEVFSPDHRRCFCYIDDAVEMLTRLLQNSRGVEQVLNLGAEQPEITIRKLAETVVRTVGKPLAIDEKPPTPGSPIRRAPKMSRMTALTGYTARIGLDAGVRSTYAWYRAHMFT